MSELKIWLKLLLRVQMKEKELLLQQVCVCVGAGKEGEERRGEERRGAGRGWGVVSVFWGLLGVGVDLSEMRKKVSNVNKKKKCERSSAAVIATAKFNSTMTTKNYASSWLFCVSKSTVFFFQ
jgi:hypothetical protein